MVDYIQATQYKSLQMTEFDPTNSADWIFDYSAGTMTNSTGLSADLLTYPIILNNFRIKKIITEGIGLSSAVLSYTTDTDLLTATWTVFGGGENDDMDLLFTNIPTTGIRFRLTNSDSVVNKMFIMFELV